MATRVSILAWEIPWAEDRGAWWATVHGVTGVGHDLVTKPPLGHWFLTHQSQGKSISVWASACYGLNCFPPEISMVKLNPSHDSFWR